MSVLNQKGEEASEEEKSTSLKLLEAIVVIYFHSLFARKSLKNISFVFHFIVVVAGLRRTICA